MTSASSSLVHAFDMQMLGTMTMGNQIDEATSHEIMDEFVNLGGVWIDTAELYPIPPSVELAGATEKIVGNWLEKRVQQDASFRKKIALATKITGRTTFPTHALRNDQDFFPHQIKQALEDSLVKLKTEYVDLYQLHWPSRPTPLWGAERFTKEMSLGVNNMCPNQPAPRPCPTVDEIVLCMGELIREKKILSWGLSNETPYGVCQFGEACRRNQVPFPVSIQNDFCLMDRRYDGALAEAAFYYDITLLSYGPLAGGTLTGKYLDPVDGTKRLKLMECRHDRFPKFQPRYYSDAAMEATRKYALVAKTHHLSLVQLSLAFCATRFYMGAVIYGANSVDQVRENFEAVKNAHQYMTAEVEDEISRVHAERPNPHVTY